MAHDTTKNQPLLIYVTGYGPFVGHETKNASWEAVQLLPDYHQINNGEHQLHIVRQEIPVVYEDVDRAVEQIWKHQPKVKPKKKIMLNNLLK